jgi:hypothetical protein
MLFPKSITISFIKSDFKGNEYLSNDDCPLARAVKRALRTHGKRGLIMGVGHIDCDVKDSNRYLVAQYICKPYSRAWGLSKFIELKEKFANKEAVEYSFTMFLTKQFGGD